MARYAPKIFDKNLPVFVKKPFKENGALLLNGQEFDWKNKAVSVQRVRQMFNANYLTHGEPDFSEEEDTVTQEEIEAAFEDQVDKMEIEKTDDLTDDLEPKTGGYKIEHKGGPWYNVVDADGNIVNENGLKQDDAIKLVESLTDGFEG